MGWPRYSVCGTANAEGLEPLTCLSLSSIEEYRMLSRTGQLCGAQDAAVAKPSRVGNLCGTSADGEMATPSELLGGANEHACWSDTKRGPFIMNRQPIACHLNVSFSSNFGYLGREWVRS